MWDRIEIQRDNGERASLTVDWFYHPGSSAPDDPAEFTLATILDSEGEDVYPTISEREAERIEEALHQIL